MDTVRAWKDPSRPVRRRVRAKLAGRLAARFAAAQPGAQQWLPGVGHLTPLSNASRGSTATPRGTAAVLSQPNAPSRRAGRRPTIWQRDLGRWRRRYPGPTTVLAGKPALTGSSPVASKSNGSSPEPPRAGPRVSGSHPASRRRRHPATAAPVRMLPARRGPPADVRCPRRRPCAPRLPSRGSRRSRSARRGGRAARICGSTSAGRACAHSDVIEHVCYEPTADRYNCCSAEQPGSTGAAARTFGFRWRPGCFSL
jgi:hypothetical protein